MRKVGTGAVLLDRSSGNVLALNETAMRISEALLQGQSADACADTIAALYQVDKQQAAGDVKQFLNQVIECESNDPDEFFTYAQGEVQYELSCAAGWVLKFSTDGLRVEGNARHTELFDHACLAASSKMLTLWGHTVLHAACIEHDGKAHAFVGRSGAGKTTTARSLAQGSIQLLAEDKLLLRAAPLGHWETSRSGEQAIMAIVSALASRLRGSLVVDAREFLPMLQNLDDWVRVQNILFLHPSLRSSDADLRCEPFSIQAATATIAGQIFQATGPEHWPALLSLAERIAMHTNVAVLRVPNTIAALRAAGTKADRVLDAMALLNVAAAKS